MHRGLLYFSACRQATPSKEGQLVSGVDSHRVSLPVQYHPSAVGLLRLCSCAAAKCGLLLCVSLLVLLMVLQANKGILLHRTPACFHAVCQDFACCLEGRLHAYVKHNKVCTLQ